MIKAFLGIGRRVAVRPRKLDVLVHIGAPKSGSSALQRLCLARRDELLSLGFFYPEHQIDANGVSAGHSEISGALISGKYEQAKATFERWLGEARGYGACLLLSSEGFYEQSVGVGELCKGLEVRVIGFLRNPIEALVSNYNQGIKRHLFTRRLNQMIPEILASSTEYLVGSPFLKWADVFGEGNCRFMSYRSTDDDLGLERRFLQQLGVEDVTEALVGGLATKVNRSYVKSALELKRLINIVLNELDDGRAQREIDKILQRYSDDATGEEVYGLSDLSPGERAYLEARLAPAFNEVVKRFPHLKMVAVPMDEQLRSPATCHDLIRPLAAIRKSAPELVELIRKRAVALRDRGRDDYAFCKLLEVLGIDFSEPVSRRGVSGLTDAQKALLRGEKIELADCLREMAVLFERQGLLEDAFLVINRAHLLRPMGQGILRVRARIAGKLELKAGGSEVGGS